MRRNNIRALTITTISITMRLSILAFFIALPAAAYAAESPLQGPECVGLGEPCDEVALCCDGFCIKQDTVSVCPITHLL
jgi:hypothetical protein